MSTGALTKFAHTRFPSTQGTLVAAIASGKAAYINNIKISNINTTTENWILYVNDGTNTYEIERGSLGEGEYSHPDPIHLVAGESIEGVTDTAAKVTFRAVGILETI